MKILFLRFVTIGLSLVDTLNWKIQKLVGNPEVRIITSQPTWSLMQCSLISCSVIMMQNVSIVAFDILKENRKCSFYSNLTNFIYDASRTTYLKSAVNGFQLNPATNVIYNSSDGLVYMFGGQRVASWQNGYDICITTQGFSILLVKKIYQFLMLVAQSNLGFNSIIGLRRNNVTGAFYWDDGTPYNMTEVSTYTTTPYSSAGPGTDIFTFRDYNIYADFSWMPPRYPHTFPACIANPFNFSLV